MHTPASYVCSGTSTNSTTALDDTDWWTAYILVILTGTLASMVSVRDVTLSYCKRFGYFLTCYACHTCCATPYSTCLDLWNECDLNVNWLCHFQCSLWLFQWPLACYLFWWHMQNCANTLINAVIILPVTSVVNLVPRSWHCVLGTLRSRSEAWHTEQEAITGKKSLRVYSSNEVHFPFHSLKSLRKIYRWQPLWGSPNMEWKLPKKFFESQGEARICVARSLQQYSCGWSKVIYVT